MSSITCRLECQSQTMRAALIALEVESSPVWIPLYQAAVNHTCANCNSELAFSSEASFNLSERQRGLPIGSPLCLFGASTLVYCQRYCGGLLNRSRRGVHCNGRCHR